MLSSNARSLLLILFKSNKTAKTKTIIDALQMEYNAENILIAPMVHSIECVKDTSNDPENDVFFAVAFRLEEKLDQFLQDWFKTTPYMSSCKYSFQETN